MTSKHFFTLALVGAGTTLATLIGCGGGGGGAANGGQTTTTTKPHSSSSSSSSGTGMGGQGNHDITMATPINIDDPATQATLVDASTSDFYTFNGKAGDRIIIGAFASQLQVEGKGFDKTVTDLTLVLTGSDMNLMMPLTYTDDAWPDFSQDALLYVQLPADGAYYVGVQDCNGLFSSGCPGTASDVASLDYQLVVAHTSKLTNPELLATGQDGTTSKAQTVKYVLPQGGKAPYYASNLIGGDLASATDTHVYSFTPPMDSVPMGTRARAEFYVEPIGSFQGGDLSDANIKIWVTDDTGTKIISQLDQNNYPTTSMKYRPMQFSAPYTVGKQYYVFVKNTMTGGSAAKDFYFIDHYLNPLIDVAEKEGPTGMGMNDTTATAETLTGQGSSKSFFTVDGDIAKAGTDVDYFTFTVPAAVTQFQMQCDSASTGSGIQGFTAELYQADGTTMITSATETDATTDILTMAANVPSTAGPGTKWFLKVSGKTQDATVTGTQYRCYVFFG